MFKTAVRDQALIALLAVVGMVVSNVINGGIERDVVGPFILLAVLCLAPAVFAWTPRAYQVAAGVLATVLAIWALTSLTRGGFTLIPATVLGWWFVLTAPRRLAV